MLPSLFFLFFVRLLKGKIGHIRGGWSIISASRNHVAFGYFS